MTVKDYIAKRFPETLRKKVRDEDTLIGLPYPYTVPCAESYFNELFYWDTYFTNKALIALGNIEQAKNNVRNILYLVERFGYMPNGSRTYFLKRSQPPYLALMADEIYRITNDLSFLKSAFPTLKKEYGFWMTKRVSENGLNHYDTEESAESCAAFFNDYVGTRIAVDRSRNAAYAGRNYYAEAESGWDFTLRFQGACTEFNPIDLNSNLYFYEEAFARYEALLGEGDGAKWRSAAQTRADKINKLLWDSSAGVYKDYNFVTGKLSPVISAVSFQPYFAGLAGEGQKSGLKKLLSVLEGKFGIFTAEYVTEKYQWAYPNLWAPCQYIAVKALEHYGYSDEAKRVAGKYVKLIEHNFETHGKLFEKYNGLTGGIDAVSGYGTPEMLGWTAGVYMAFEKDAKKEHKQ